MKLLQGWFKPKAPRLFERAIARHDYARAFEIIQSNRIPEHLVAVAKCKQSVFEAVSSSACTESMMGEVKQTVAKLWSPDTISGLEGPERTSVYLAMVSYSLTSHKLNEALDLAGRIQPKEGRAQALRKIAGYMACNGRDEKEIVDVITALPIPAYIGEELRNLFLSKILLKDFDCARRLLSTIPQTTRKGLEPQLAFVERNHSDIALARRRARDLIHPDDIALTMALVMGANNEFESMAHCTADVSPQIRLGAYATYASGLAYAGKTSAAIALLEDTQDQMHEYLLRLGYLVFTFPLSSDDLATVSRIFSETEPYEGTLAFWYHQFLEHLIGDDIEQIDTIIKQIANHELRIALAGLFADFIAGVNVPA